MASHSLKRKAEELSALVDRINGEIGAASTGKKSRLDPGLTAKTKAELLKAFVDQHLNENGQDKSIVPDSPATTLDQATETPIVLDREAFLKRLQTYSALFTYGKPISPVECARHGWIDTRQYQTDHLVSKLRCELCSGVVYVTDVKHGASNELLHSIREKYLKGLSGLHEKNCIWKYSECDEWVYSFPFYTSYDAVKQWQENLGRIIASNITLPNVQSPLSAENMRLLEKLLKLEHELDTSSPAADWLRHNQLESSLILPLFGWNLHVIEERPLLKCDLCFRAVGLWNYSNTGEALNSIDAEKEHRPYCPWINRNQAQIVSTLATPYNSQKSAPPVCGWEFMLNTITIECKHLEEMYDLSPKAEQQRRKLHSEAQMLMNAAKSRLSEVLNGKWMKEMPVSPVANKSSESSNGQIAEESVIPATQAIPDAQAEQLNEHVTEAVQELSHDNEKIEGQPVQATTDTTDMEYSERIDEAQSEVIAEENMEMAASSHIPVEITMSADDNEQESEISDEANLVTSIAKPELQTLETIRDSAKFTSPGSSLDVNLSTLSSPTQSYVELDASATADTETSVGMSENEQSVSKVEEELLAAVESSSEVEQEISHGLEGENLLEKPEATAPSSMVSHVEEAEVEQYVSEDGEYVPDADIESTEVTEFNETSEPQLANEIPISVVKASETVNQYYEEKQDELQEDSFTHDTDIETTAVDAEVQDQQLPADDIIDDSLVDESIAKEINREDVEAEENHAEVTGIIADEVLSEEQDNAYGTSVELDELQDEHQDNVTDIAQPGEETVEKTTASEPIESANEDVLEAPEQLTEELDVQDTAENEGMNVDLTGNEDEEMAEITKEITPEDEHEVAEDEIMADGTDDVIQKITENIVGNEDESVREDTTGEHMVHEIAESSNDDENMYPAADIQMETQTDAVEESENAVHTDENDASQYVEMEALSESEAQDEQNEINTEAKEESSDTPLPELPMLTEQVGTPSAFGGYDELSDNHEVLSPATTAAINEQINNMDNDNELLAEPEKTRESEERQAVKGAQETQETPVGEINASDNDDVNDILVDLVPNITQPQESTTGDAKTAATATSDNHEFPEPLETEGKEEQDQSDFQEDTLEDYTQAEEVESKPTQEAAIVFQESHQSDEKDDSISAHHEGIQEIEITGVSSDIQDVEDISQTQTSDIQNGNIPIQIEEISPEVAEQQYIEVANQEATDDNDSEKEVATTTHDDSNETPEDMLSGETDENDQVLTLVDLPQDESPEYETVTAKDQDVEDVEQQEEEYTLQEQISEEAQVIPSETTNLTTASEQEMINDELDRNKVRIEVDGNALIEEPETEPNEEQVEGGDGFASADDEQLDDYIDADQFDSVDTEQVIHDMPPEPTALVSFQAHSMSDNEKDNVAAESSNVEEITDENVDISDAYNLVDEDQVATMFEAEQSMDDLETLTENDNEMADSIEIIAQNATVANNDPNVIDTQTDDSNMAH
ncbi:hypothetical protein VKS41_001626 [Umbelopsis sp. WA50703]